MTAIGTTWAAAIALVALAGASHAIAAADERMRCAPPAAHGMTIYRPPCATNSEDRGAALLPPKCSPPLWASEAPCSAPNADWWSEREYFVPHDFP
jgi:hypothetical protein